MRRQPEFYTATETEITTSAVADVYFHRAVETLTHRAREETRVHAEITYKSGGRSEWFVVAGLEEVARLLSGTEGVEVTAVPEGAICRPHEPVMTLSGSYGEFCQHETAILGLLCQASGIATAAAHCKLAAGERSVVSFGARRMHPAITPMIERAAYIGGCDSVAVELATERFGIPSTGTMPHAVALVLGSTAEAARAFDEAVDPEVPRAIQIDTYDDERFGALLAARAIPDSIEAVRLDTPGSRRGDFAELLREVRWELDRAGYAGVKIYASGGLGVDDILALNPYCDAYGIGGTIAGAPVVDYSLDIVEVEGSPRSKRGKLSGRKLLVQAADGSRWVLPADAELPAGARSLLRPLTELYAEVPTARQVRQRVIEQLQGGGHDVAVETVGE